MVNSKLRCPVTVEMPVCFFSLPCNNLQQKLSILRLRSLKLQKSWNSAARVISSKSYLIKTNNVLSDLKFQLLNDGRIQKKAMFVHTLEFKSNELPESMSRTFIVTERVQMIVY